MTKFDIFWAAGTERCNTCRRKINSEEIYLRLIQNRYTQPCICINCLKELIKKGEDIKNKKYFTPEFMKKNKRIYPTKNEPSRVSKTGWMEAW